MQEILMHAPLIVFTALCSMGAGAYIPLAVNATVSPEGQMQPNRKLALIPVALLLVGFVAVVFHVTAPLNALKVVNGVGQSPLSNEVIVGGAFLALCIVHAILVSAGKIPSTANKAFLWVLAAGAMLFAAFMGLAYGVHTIPAWDTPASPVSMVGLAVFGGIAVGELILGFSGEAAGGSASAKKALVAIAAVAAAAAGAALFVQHGIAIGAPSFAHNGSEMGSKAMPLMIAYAALAASSLALSFISCSKRENKALVVASAGLALLAVFAARCAFYLLEVGLGL